MTVIKEVFFDGLRALQADFLKQQLTMSFDELVCQAFDDSGGTDAIENGVLNQHFEARVSQDVNALAEMVEIVDDTLKGDAFFNQKPVVRALYLIPRIIGANADGGA